MKHKPIKLGSEQFIKLQRKWYKKVAKTGHTDVERYQDFNKLPVSTMPRLHGSFLFDPETGELSDEAEVTPLPDTDKAGFWREVGRKASAMAKGSTKQEKLLYKLANSFAEHGTFMAAARDCGISRNPAETMLKQWLRDNGLKDATGLSRQHHEKLPDPGPVKVLTKEEIAKLNLKPPRSE